MNGESLKILQQRAAKTDFQKARLIGGFFVQEAREKGGSSFGQNSLRHTRELQGLAQRGVAIAENKTSSPSEIR